MKGLDLSRQWFETAGRAWFQDSCPEIFPRLAFGLAGHGSECFGYDDAISRDHDFTAAFSVWIDDGDEPEHGFQLTRAYTAFLRQCPPPVSSMESVGGAPEQGVLTIGAFFNRHLGSPEAPATWQQWLYTPEHAFAESTNGQVFLDGLGRFTAIRQAILKDMPKDVWLKKLAARTALAAQSGQYNFTRCLKHGERGAARLALAEFVRQACGVVFLLNHRFAPYYKWLFRAMRELPVLANLAPALEGVLAEGLPDSLCAELIEDICTQLANELRAQGLTSCPDNYLEPHALELTRLITNREIRALHLMDGGG